MAGRRKGKIRRALPFIGLLIGICLVAWPAVSDYLERMWAEEQFSTVTGIADPKADPEYARLLEQATQYNRLVADSPDYREPEGGLLPYDRQLSWHREPYMAWLQIPAISLKLPIYHGTTDKSLAAGVGHLEGTSLPVGGTPSTCVLAGHSGVRQSRVFDDIRDLEKGDIVILWSLAEPYAYRVTDIRIVEPQEEAEYARILPDRDRLVLITCTSRPDKLHPRGRIGINDRRLVVQCDRTEYDAGLDTHDDPLRGILASSRIRPFLVALAILLTVLLLSLAARSVRKTKARGATLGIASEPDLGLADDDMGNDTGTIRGTGRTANRMTSRTTDR